jgi:hypothetical protein
MRSKSGIVEEMWLLGREAMQGWAEKRVEVTEREIRQQPHMHRQGKKLCGIRKSAKSGALKPQYRLGRERVRPFVRSAKVTHRTCSRPLQSAIADFAADQAFAQTGSSCRSTMAS